MVDFLKRFAPALLLAFLIIGTSPIMGQLRDFFFAAFPGQALRAIAVVLVVLVSALFLLALWRIREYRKLRYGGLLLVFALLFLQVVGLGRGIAQVDIVERIHVLEYGTLAALVFWGIKRRAKPASWPELALYPIFAATLSGVLDESAQLLFQLRIADFRDVLLNAFAALVGVLFAASLAPPTSWASGRSALPGVLRFLALTLLGLGVFLVKAHFGYEINDPELGRFRSWHSADELRQAAKARLERWSVSPPDGHNPWARKDLYLDEAARHAGFRNSSLARGDFASALRANQILEKYYDPFLDVEGFRGTGRHRWPPEQLAEVEAKADDAKAKPPAAKSYDSPVLRDYLVIFPKIPFLAGLLAIVALLFLGAGRFKAESFKAG